MEAAQNHDEVDSTPESPEAASEGKEEEGDDDSTDDEYVDSSEREEQYEDRNENGSNKNMEFINRNSPQDTSVMEGELDFEDEVREDKEDISKGSFDDDSQRETADQEKFMEKMKDLEDEKKTCLSAEEEDDEGQLSPSDKASKEAKEEGLIEEGEDDGEVSDEDDLEEGEVKDASPNAKQQARQVCRFFNRGQCTWGNLCRFLHLSVNDRGNYNMFAPSSKGMPPYSMPGNGMGMLPGPMGPRRSGPEYHPPPPMPPIPPPPVPAADPAPVESAWERGLRHAKELMKKALRRKEQEPDFEEKRLNLSIDENDRVAGDFDKDNEYFAKTPFRRQDSFNNRFDEPDDVFDNGEQEARERWRGGHYENFEIKWTRQDTQNKDRRENKELNKNTRFSAEREKPKQWKGKNWRDERLSEVQTSRTRADEWRDPWRRSKTPKGRRSRSRGRSRGSYSSVSSRSYSGRSSRSSYSYSRSSSRSSFYSSRSRSPDKPSPKHKLSPRKENAVAVKVPSPYKRRPIVLRRTRSRSYSRSRSSHSLSHSRSTSSRSVTRTPSVSRSRSRSYSRSLSMDSVSSASSSISRSSSRSGSKRNRNAQVSAPRKGGDTSKAAAAVVKVESKPPATTSLFAEIQRLRQYGKMRETQKSGGQKKTDTATPSVPSRENLEPDLSEALQYSQSVIENTIKEPPRQAQTMPKQQIKLTLLNKVLPSKIPNPLKKEDVNKLKVQEKDEKQLGKVVPKRSDSPSKTLKRSTSSRRDELLKQLKAVEDAIARKRAKFS